MNFYNHYDTLRILQVSVSGGRLAPVFGSWRRSAWANKFCRCWSLVYTVEIKLKPTAKIGFWLSIHVISGPANCKHKKKNMTDFLLYFSPIILKSDHAFSNYFRFWILNLSIYSSTYLLMTSLTKKETQFNQVTGHALRFQLWWSFCWF